MSACSANRSEPPPGHHLLLWAAIEPRRLSQAAREFIEASENELYVSAASLWEIAIKRSLGREDFDVDARVLRRALLENGCRELVINSEHAMTVDGLPALHKDPFDRLLLAQSMAEGLLLLTSDPLLAKYPAPVRLV